MANQSKNISQTVKGQIWDFHPMHLTDGMYAFAQNAVVESLDGSGFPILQNEPSNILAVNLPSGFQVIGFQTIVEQDRILWFLYNPDTGVSSIGETQNPGDCRKNVVDSEGTCDDCSLNLLEGKPLETITQTPCSSYHNIQSDSCLNFSLKYPVKSIVYRITDCGIDVVFTDDNNNRRFIQFEYVDDDPSKGLVIKQRFYEIIGFENPPCDTPIYGPNLNCNALNIQPNIPTPCIEFDDVVTGGSLKAGDYQFFVAMSDISGNRLTSYFSATNPIPIFTKEITTLTDYATDRAIKLSILNLDIEGAYQYYNIAVAKTIDGVTSFFLVGTFPVTQHSYTYTGNNRSEISLSADIIFAKYPYYQTAGAIAESNGILYWANLKEYPRPNLQRVANNIVLQWQTIAIPEAAYWDPKNTAKYRSYMRDEVYAIGVQFIFNTGDESNAYHIPGREAIAGDLDVINNDDVFVPNNCTSETPNLRWQVYNTGTLLGGDLSIYNGCEESCYQYGDFAYWESSERYPTNPEIWGDLCGQQIRHHKFPDSLVTHIHNLENGAVDASGGTYIENNLVFPIGIRVDHNSVRASIAQAVIDGLITQADADSIVGYRIIRGNRFGNKSVVCKGLLYDVNQYQRTDGSTLLDNTPIYFANYPFNDLHANPFVTTDFQDAYGEHDHSGGPNLAFTFSNRYTFHSPDTHFNEPGIGTELKLETVEYGSSEGYFNIAKKQAKQKLLSNFSYGIAITLGIVAALTRVQEKETITYTVKGDYKINQDDSDISEASFDTGQDISGTTTGVWAGLVEGELTGTITTTNAGGSIGSHTFSHPEITQDNSNLTGDNAYGVDDGMASQPIDAAGNSVDEIEAWSRVSTKGLFNQYFSPTTDLVPSWLSPLSTFTGILQKIPATINVILEELNLVTDLIKSFTAYRDWCIQYQAIGKYNHYTTVLNNAGVKRRVISTSSYLDDNNQTIDEPVNFTTGQFDVIKFNNLARESSLYLKYAGVALPNAGVSSGVVDSSRITLNGFPVTCTLNKRVYTPISSYYASIKNYVPDQYGTIYNIDYLRTGSCAFDMLAQTSGCTGVYGGDTFINRFALKIKLEYFLATTFLLPDGTDFDYTSVTNLAFPRNYYNNTGGFEFDNILDFLNPTNLISDLGRPKSYRACQTNKLFYQNGYIYLYHYGIPYFLVESDYNVDYRYGINDAEGDFFPHQQNLENWLQQDVVPIVEPNQYHYNNTYSKQNSETSIAIDAPNFEPGRDCRVNHPNRIISSQGQNWLIYPPNDFYDAPLSDGPIVAVDGIENQTVLIRSENKTRIFKSILRQQVDGQTVQVGNGGPFVNPPQDFGTTTLGYIGTQNRAILHTEYGHITVDAKRGQIFNIATGASGIDEISKNGMKNWFKENLPFRLLRDFKNMPTTDIDNNFIGSGLILSFDKRYNRFTMTKLDWKKLSNMVVYDPDNKEFFLSSGDTQIPITLGDPRYFKDCSWTASYNFWTQSWIAFHSYKPNYYIDFIDFFSSGINGSQSSYWVHDLYYGSFQVFYGKLYPFVVEPVVKFEEQLKVLNAVEFDTEVRRYANEVDYTVKKQIPGFNKAIIYNDTYNSGELNLVKVNKNDFTLTGKYPKKNFNSWDVEVAIADYKWRVNQFYNLIKDNTEIPSWLYQGNNAEKNLNRSAFNYGKNDLSLPRLRGQWFKTRYINDSLSNYKILFKFDINDQTLQFR